MKPPKNLYSKTNLRVLALEIQNIKRWSEVKDKVIALRETVHVEVERCVNEAREDYEKRALTELSRQFRCMLNR